jgi:hypothetical protein
MVTLLKKYYSFIWIYKIFLLKLGGMNQIINGFVPRVFRLRIEGNIDQKL